MLSIYLKKVWFINEVFEHFIDYYNGVLMPSTGYVTVFDLIPYYDGMLLRMPDKHHPDRLPYIRE